MQDSQQELLRTRLFRVVRHSLTTPDGQTITRETVQHPGAVAILPLLDDGRVCLIRNFRIAVNRTLLELPAGTLEPGEDPDETARRELIEETGYRCTQLRKLQEFFMSPGILNERMHLYLATGLVAGEMQLEEHEQIQPELFSWDDAMQLVARGEVQDAKTLVGLLLWDRMRGE